MIFPLMCQIQAAPLLQQSLQMGIDFSGETMTGEVISVPALYLQNFQGSSSTGIGTEQNTDKPDLVSGMLIRMILDYADDVDEAVEIAKSFDLHDVANSPNHYMVADERAAMDILDYVSFDGKRTIYSVIYNLTDRSVLWVCHEHYDDETAIFEFKLK